MPVTRRKFRLNNMTGLMNTLNEENAYITFDPGANYGSGLTSIGFEFKNVTNFQPIYRGGLSKTTGFSLYKNVGASTPIRAIGRYQKSDGTNHFIVAYGGNVYRLSTLGVLTSLSMTVSDVYLSLLTAQDILIICDGTNVPKTWNGITSGVLCTGSDATAATGFKQAIYDKSRVFAFSSTHDTSLVYYSNPGVTNAGYASNFIACDTNDGQKITCLAKFFVPGSLDPVIIVGKERSIGIIFGDGTTQNPFTFTKISNDFGIPGFRQTSQFEQDIAFLTPRGVSSYKTAQTNANIEQKLLTGKVYNDFANLSVNALPDAHCWYDWKNRRISFAVAGSNNIYPDTIYHLDLASGGVYKQTGFNVCCAFVDNDGTLYTGDNLGNIFVHSKSQFSYNGSPISATLTTPYLDFFDSKSYKRIIEAEIVFRGNGAYPFGISGQIDYGLQASGSISINSTSGNYTWGNGLWTTDSIVYQWGATPLVRQKFFPTGLFKNISFTIAQSGANQPLDLLEILFDVEYLERS